MRSSALPVTRPTCQSKRLTGIDVAGVTPRGRDRTLTQPRGRTNDWRKDIVCGEPVAYGLGEAVLQREWRGIRFPFCSLNCADAFEQEPARYLPASVVDGVNVRRLHLRLGAVDVRSALKLDFTLSDMTAVQAVVVNQTRHTASVIFDAERASARRVVSALAAAGCEPLARAVNLPVAGLYCRNCAVWLDRELEATAGVVFAASSIERGEVGIIYDPEEVTLSALEAAIARAGFQLDLATLTG